MLHLQPVCDFEHLLLILHVSFTDFVLLFITSAVIRLVDRRSRGLSLPIRMQHFESRHLPPPRCVGRLRPRVRSHLVPPLCSRLSRDTSHPPCSSSPGFCGHSLLKLTRQETATRTRTRTRLLLLSLGLTTTWPTRDTVLPTER